jgi:hypothetical protein
MMGGLEEEEEDQEEVASLRIDVYVCRGRKW